jgi:hypothetical protein
MGQGFHKPTTEGNHTKKNFCLRGIIILFLKIQERLQNAKRLLQRAKRETEREKLALATEEEALKRELRKTVEKGDLVINDSSSI